MDCEFTWPTGISGFFYFFPKGARQAICLLLGLCTETVRGLRHRFDLARLRFGVGGRQQGYRLFHSPTLRRLGLCCDRHRAYLTGLWWLICDVAIKSLCLFVDYVIFITRNNEVDMCTGACVRVCVSRWYFAGIYVGRCCAIYVSRTHDARTSLQSTQRGEQATGLDA